MQKRRLSVIMSKGEWIGGLCFLPFYLLLLSLGLQILLTLLLRRAPSTLELNLCFYTVNLIAVLLIFRRFLAANLRTLRENIRKLLISIPTALFLYFFLTILVGLIVLSVEPTFQNENNSAVLVLLEGNPLFTAVLSIVLAPLIEETMFRGLIFGNLYHINRVLAYLVTALGFSAIHVIGYLGVLSPVEILLSLLQYIPATVILCGVYAYTDTIYAPMLLHAIINLIAFAAMGIMR